MALESIPLQKVVDIQLTLRSKPVLINFFDEDLIPVNFVMRILSD
ncbi:hypothetical protein PRO82_000304 [Candidatus Protochlamydia amoebophila]|nr:hypothetical protein [Candidatus Protochlamydia amoebophila]